MSAINSNPANTVVQPRNSYPVEFKGTAFGDPAKYGGAPSPVPPAATGGANRTDSVQISSKAQALAAATSAVTVKPAGATGVGASIQFSERPGWATGTKG